MKYIRRFIFLISLVSLMSCERQVNNMTPAKILHSTTTLNPSIANPLAAIINITTDIETTVTITIKGQDNNDLVHHFQRLSTKHTIPVLGLYPDYENIVTITLLTQSGVITTFEKRIKTEAVDVPTLNIIKKDVSKIAEGFIMIQLIKTNGMPGLTMHNIMIDEHGKVRWIYNGGINHIFKPLRNGNYIIDNGNGYVSEIDLIGTTHAYYMINRDVHHDLVEMPNGNLLYLSSAENSTDDAVSEIDRYTRQVVRSWDLRTILDPLRPSAPKDSNSRCWFHANGIDYDPSDDSFIVSGRSQSAVVKIDRKSGQLVWILGNHTGWSDKFKPYLFTPQGGNFEWQWGQHAPQIHPKNRNKILIFDNGSQERNTESPLPAAQNYSRAVEYEINPYTKTIVQNWEWGKKEGSAFYSSYISNATYASEDNVLICFGGILTTINGEAADIYTQNVRNEVKIVEVNYNTSEVVFEIHGAPEINTLIGYRAYRAYKIKLYE